MGKDHGAKGPPGVGAWGGVLELETQSLGLGLGGALGVSSVRTYRTDLSGHTELVQGFGGSGVEAAGVSKARLVVTAIGTEVRTVPRLLRRTVCPVRRSTNYSPGIARRRGRRSSCDHADRRSALPQHHSLSSTS